MPENVRGSSIDLTLGEWYWACRGDRGGIYNPFDRDAVARYFLGPWQAELWPTTRQLDGHFRTTIPAQLEGIPDDHPIIILPARARILAHTHEFVGIKAPGTSEMRARSSWGRNGIMVCACAGWGDPGYINRWTMEIANLNDAAVPLPVGERVAQLIFHTTGDVEGAYGEGGKYQTSVELDEVIAGWTPQAMLPRSYKDERRLPTETGAFA